MQYPLINQWKTYPAPHKSLNKNEKILDNRPKLAYLNLSVKPRIFRSSSNNEVCHYITDQYIGNDSYEVSSPGIQN